MSVSTILAGILVCLGIVLLVIYFFSEATMVILGLGVMSVIMGAFLCADVFTRRD